MILDILAHTPKWVFAVFALLLWIGSRQLRGGRVGLGRVALLPVAMTGLSAWGVVSAFGQAAAPLAGWAFAAAILALAVASRPMPDGVRYDAARRSFELPGSAVPLALMMGIFLTKYAVGVLLAMHPSLARDFDFSLALGTLYGAFTGIFAGRAFRLWTLALRAARGPAADALLPEIRA